MPADYCIVSTAFGVLAGYFIKSRISRDSADRKEDRAKLDGISDDVGKVEELAYQYYSLPHDAGESKQLSLQINRLMKKIGSETYQISVVLEEVCITQLQLAFKQKVTLNSDYESSSRLPRVSGAPFFGEISDAARRLVGGMELAFRKKYRNHNKSSFGA